MKEVGTQKNDYLISTAGLLSGRLENTRRWLNDGFMLAHRLWRRPNIKPTLC